MLGANNFDTIFADKIEGHAERKNGRLGQRHHRHWRGWNIDGRFVLGAFDLVEINILGAQKLRASRSILRHDAHQKMLGTHITLVITFTK